MPIYLAWTSQVPLSRGTVDLRLKAILRFLHLDDLDRFRVHLITDGKCGLAFIDYKRNTFNIPLIHKTTHTLSLSAYLPFGASTFVDRSALRTGEYLPELLELLRKSPQTLFDLAPPQVLCQLDCREHKLTVCNDWRGFGRLYEYKTAFGTIWSNKMAAALMFAGLPARLDETSLADMAACGMFSGSGTGYKNLNLVAPGSFIEVGTLSGKITTTPLSSAAGGLIRREPEPDAVEKAHAAISRWMEELRFFNKSTIRLNLSGGRDSRVVGAALLAAGLDCEIAICSPPTKDAELARQLLKLANVGALVKNQDRRQEIKAWYAEQGSLLDIAGDFLRTHNSDISVKLFFSWPMAISDADSGILYICGNQGEVAHNCYYTPELVAQERAWERTRHGIKPSQKRIRGLTKTFSFKSFGVTKYCGESAAKNIKNNVLEIAEEARFFDWYVLDYICFHLCCTRQWPGANGAFDHKTPLTVYPYAFNGFNQTIESKIHTHFVRDVVSLFIPVWKEIPFFHELKKEETKDFYIAYPTYWEMGRGEDLLEICSAENYSWNFFERNTILETFKNMLNTTYIDSISTTKISNINTTAQKIVWITKIYDSIKEYNNIINNYIF